MNFGTLERTLTSQELKVGRRVFQDTIKWSQVRITDGSGAGNSVFTNAGIGQDTIHMTKKHYNNPPYPLLVHELTHVWQATNHGITGLGYKLNSLAHQGYHMARTKLLGGSGRNAAYTYDPKLLGKKGWGKFSVEEQAQIVEEWFKRGEKTSDPAFRYIYWCIREKKYITGPMANFVPPEVPWKNFGRLSS
jgi:hypothetical protein